MPKIVAILVQLRLTTKLTPLGPFQVRSTFAPPLTLTRAVRLMAVMDFEAVAVAPRSSVTVSVTV